jgi:hypothetical protein
MARLKYRSEEIEVEYNTVGTYVMATYDNPAEYPDFEIDAVYYNGVDILPILSYEDQEEINELLTEYLYD